MSWDGWLGDLAGGSGWGWLTAMAVAGMVLALVPPSPRRPPSIRRAGGVGVPQRSAAVRWLAGRPDAWSVRRRTTWAFVVAAVLGVTMTAMGLTLPVAVGAATAAAGVGWVWLGRIESDLARRRREQLVEDLPEVCDLLSGCLSAGLPLRGAAAAVAQVVGGPAADDLSRVGALVAVGEPEPSAWRGLRDDPVWGPLAVDLARAVESGTPVGATLVLHGEQARAGARQIRERRARTAGVRSVLPMMVCFLPAFFCVGIVPLIAGLVLGMLR